MAGVSSYAAVSCAASCAAEVALIGRIFLSQRDAQGWLYGEPWRALEIPAEDPDTASRGEGSKGGGEDGGVTKMEEPSPVWMGRVAARRPRRLRCPRRRRGMAGERLCFSLCLGNCLRD